MNTIEQNTDRIKLKPVDPDPHNRLQGDLKEAETNMKVMRAILGRTLTDGDRYALLQESTPKQVQVIPKTLVNFRIPC